jgi:hypothetical protein
MKPLSTVILALFFVNLLTCVTSKPDEQPKVTKPVDPYIEKMEKNNGDVFSGNSGGNHPLHGTPYGYEIWSAGGNNNRLI